MYFSGQISNFSDSQGIVYMSNTYTNIYIKKIIIYLLLVHSSMHHSLKEYLLNTYKFLVLCQVFSIQLHKCNGPYSCPDGASDQFYLFSCSETYFFLDSTWSILVTIHSFPWVIHENEYQKPWLLHQQPFRCIQASLLLELMSIACQKRTISDYLFKVSMQNEDVWKWLTMPATYL